MTQRLPHTDRWGVVTRYQDAMRRWHQIPAKTHRAILDAMGVDEEDESSQAVNQVLVLRPGQRFRVGAPAELVLEDGTTLGAITSLPPDLPAGYHELRMLDGRGTIHVLATPGRCHLSADLKTWGWALQLYALRSRRSVGMGDFGDLRELARWSRRELGAGFLLLNPVGANLPVHPQEPSPYYPSSRRFRNPLYLRVEDVPGAGEMGPTLEKLAAAGRELNQHSRIDRDAILRAKLAALHRIFARFRGDPAFDRYRMEQGPALREFATFNVLATTLGGGWTQWPARFRRPDSAAVTRFAANHARAVRFHEWLQWLLDCQLATAARELPLMLDLPIGVNPSGADAWAWQDVLAGNMAVGAPPDAYNTLGQNWGLPPFIPHRLRAAGYVPFRDTVRAMLRHAGGLRIDHVMGLFRLFWIPRGKHARDGAFVRYHADELLAILDIESQRAGAVVVGEDLGTVERGVRSQLRRHAILSYRLLWFESKPPCAYPRPALAAVTTHDLFTIAGLWNGADLGAQERLGLHPNVEGTLAIRKRLARALDGHPAAPVESVIGQTHRHLAGAPCMMLTATLDDALAVEERPNMPGTTTQWPNWCIPLPQSLEQIRRNALVRNVARGMSRKAQRPLRPHPRQAKRANSKTHSA